MKEIRITVRLTKEEKEQLKKRAEEEGMTLSDYVRSRLRGVKRRRKPQTEEKKLKREWLYELNRIGVNLNQIAKSLNYALRNAEKEEFFSAVTEGIGKLSRIEEELYRLAEVVKGDNQRR